MRRPIYFIGLVACLLLLLVQPTQYSSATVPSPTPVRTVKAKATFMSPKDLKAWLDKMTRGGKAIHLDVVPDDDGQNWAFPHANDLSNARVNLNGAALAVPWLDNDRLQDPDEYASLNPGEFPPGRSTRSYVSDYGNLDGYGHVVVVFQFAGSGVNDPDNPAVWNFHQVVIMTSQPGNCLYAGSDYVKP